MQGTLLIYKQDSETPEIIELHTSCNDELDKHLPTPFRTEVPGLDKIEIDGVVRSCFALAFYAGRVLQPDGDTKPSSYLIEGELIYPDCGHDHWPPPNKTATELWHKSLLRDHAITPFDYLTGTVVVGYGDNEFMGIDDE